MIKKFARFIVNKRFVISIVMGIITIVFGILIIKVKITNDMTKYLDDDSNMKKGLVIMDSEFASVDSPGDIRIMFTNLDDSEKLSIQNQLNEMEYVDSVSYEYGNEAYNKDNRTLYVIHTEYDLGTKEERSLEKSLKREFSTYRISYYNTNEDNSEVPVWILVASVGLLIVILLIMSKSWLEPVLFLLVTGAAVVINFGTNIFLPYVSLLTASIGPILQLVLTMDYSIILINRFRQEIKLTDNRKEAMIKALEGAFPSIAASGFTTIVGLIVLALLSFKIGPELGIVLAKGVFISMITVLTLLPMLILACFNGIKRSKKKTIHVDMDGFGRFSYKTRVLIPSLFALIFVASTILQSFTPITFTMGIENPVTRSFPEQNDLVLLYNNDDDISVLIPLLEELENVDSVTGYSNTLGVKLTSSEMISALSTFNESFNIDQNIVNLVYYQYHNGVIDDMTGKEFVGSLLYILNDETLAPYIEPSIQSYGPLLSKMLVPNALTTPIGHNEMSAFLNISSDKTDLIYIDYQASTPSYDPSISLSASDCVLLLKNHVVSNPTFASLINNSLLQNIDLLVLATDKVSMQEQKSAIELANLLGVDASTISLLFMLNGKSTMSLYELVSTILSNPLMASMLEPTQANQLSLLKLAMDSTLADAIYTYDELATLLEVDTSLVKLLYTYKVAIDGSLDLWQLSIDQFINFIATTIIPDEDFSNLISDGDKSLVLGAQSLIDVILDDNSYNSSELYSKLSGLSSSLSSSYVNLLYLYKSCLTHYDNSLTMQIDELTRYLATNILDNPTFSSFFTPEIRELIINANLEVQNNVNLLKGSTHSRLLISTSYPEESKETLQFVEHVNSLADEKLSSPSYLIGESQMVYEMNQTFHREYLLISIVTAAAIFVVVMLTFKSLIIPLLLVLLVQCAVFITTAYIGLKGDSVYYLALLIVQSIMMGATIDYAIVLTSYYKESRKTLEPLEALINAYQKSIHTILTSGLMLMLVTFLMGIFTTQITSEVLITLATGTFCSILLILFILPGILSLSDHLIIRNKKESK